MGKGGYMKARGWQVYLLAGLISLVYGYLTAKALLLGIGITGIVAGVLILAICIARPETGFYITFVYAMVVSEISRMVFPAEMQAGVFLDILLTPTLVGVIAAGMKKEENAFLFRSGAFSGLLILFIYVFLEVCNPFAKSFEGWSPAVRKMLEEIVMLFVAFHVLRSEAAIGRFVKVLFVTVVLAGVYGCYQQWVGLPQFDLEWVKADKVRWGLFFIMGDMRKFSFLSDPTDYGMDMAACAVFFLILSIYQRGKRRWLILVSLLPVLLGMSYSGTRTSNIMVVSGIGVYILLSLDKKVTRIFAISAALVLVVLIRSPIYSNNTLNRFRSSFSGTQDASFNLRELERRATQPYILPHPFGGGLGTTNDFGTKYNAGHPMAGMQTDDGYLRVCLEIGWVGLIIVCVWNFQVMKDSIRGYFRASNERTKSLYAATLGCLFSFILARLAQETVGQVVVDIVYFPLIGLIIRLNYMGSHDKKRNNAL
jgi:putative inorganic carbon (hco3(-)) transporter